MPQIRRIFLGNRLDQGKHGLNWIQANPRSHGADEHTDRFFFLLAGAIGKNRADWNIGAVGQLIDKTYIADKNNVYKLT